MFISLLIATFCISFVVSTLAVIFFSKPISNIMGWIISDEISGAWVKYLKFAIYITGVSSGVRIWELEKYITKPMHEGAEIVALTSERWIFEIYRSVVGTLEGIAWMLLVFFVIALIAYVIVRGFEVKREHKQEEHSE